MYADHEARTKCLTEWFPTCHQCHQCHLSIVYHADKHALHDIRFRFMVDNIWTAIANNDPELKPNEVSKDISLDPIITQGLTIRITIHHTDTISVIVVCSLNPVAVDAERASATF